MNLGDNLRRIRKTANVSQYELAQRAGISKSQVSRMESGEQRNPQIQTLIAICAALGTTLDDLVYGKAPENMSYLTRAIENLDDEDKKIAHKMLMGWVLACQTEKMK